jgi:hypothetical protein
LNEKDFSPPEIGDSSPRSQIDSAPELQRVFPEHL